MLLGIDIGGTFTDFVCFDGQNLRMHKVLSTPNSPENAILQGLQAMNISFNNLRVIHGSTVATNAVLEGKGARTVYITNRGLKDVLSIGRQARRQLYNLHPGVKEPPVPEHLCLETGGRLAVDGEVIDPLTEDDIATVLLAIKELKPESAAINFLFSYIDDKYEQTIAKSLPSDVFVSCSSSILPEQREYERGITTWLNAYIGPLMQGYLHNLEDQLQPANLSVMRSSGTICSVEQAGNEAVHLLLSGPAGGLSGAQFIGKNIGSSRLLTFDMGGTSTDVALVDGEIGLTSQGKIADYPVGIPMVDMHTIGAGGGSLAYLDAGGALQVGPESAGANPGPACYGQGGMLPTVTDANLVLGHLPRNALLGGSMPLDYDLAYKAVSSLVNSRNHISVEEFAAGIIRIANEHMVQALRTISVHRGIDPRDFILVAFGGAGGMHVCALAEALGIKHAMTPVEAGVLSAMGMIVAPPGRQLSKTIGLLLKEISDDFINAELDKLLQQATRVLVDEGVDTVNLKNYPSLDVCYRGQSYTLNILWDGLTNVEEAFHREHENRFGHCLEMPVEIINVRLGVQAEPHPVELSPVKNRKHQPFAEGAIYGHEQSVEIYRRDDLGVGKQIPGPVIIMDDTSTTYVAQDWQCKLDSIGNLILETF